jgi:hypothetical protein
MKRITILSLLSFLFFLIITSLSIAATLSNFNDDGSRNWDNYLEDNSYQDFTIDIPSSGTLTAGTPLNTPFAGKYLIFDKDVTFTTVSDYHVEKDWSQGWRALHMLDTGDADQIVMTLHGFSVSGLGFELKPNSDGWYWAGFEYSGKTFKGSANGNGGAIYDPNDENVTYYSPYFFGTITDGVGEDDITSITLFSDIITDSGLSPTGFYFGDIHFIESAPVPIPSTMSLLGIGLLCIARISRKK